MRMMLNVFLQKSKYIKRTYKKAAALEWSAQRPGNKEMKDTCNHSLTMSERRSK